MLFKCLSNPELIVFINILLSLRKLFKIHIAQLEVLLKVFVRHFMAYKHME